MIFLFNLNDDIKVKYSSYLGTDLDVFAWVFTIVLETDGTKKRK